MSTCRSPFNVVLVGLLAVASLVTAADIGREASPLVLPDRIGEFVRAGDSYSYSRDTLFEYINGHAEFYLSAGFVALVGNDYRLESDPAVMYRIDSYDMGKDLYAFGALMEGAGGQGRPVDVGTRAFETEGALTFVAGPYLFKLTTSDATVDLPGVGARLIEALEIDVAAELQVQVPMRGKPIRTTFIKENYKSLDFLADVVEQQFLIDGEEITAFVTHGPEGSTAEDVRRALVDFLAYDEIPVEVVESDGYRVYRVDDPYEGEWFFVLINDSLLGVFAEPSPSLLARLPKSKAADEE